LRIIAESEDIAKIWASYRKKYSYAEEIEFVSIMKVIYKLI